MSPSAGLAYLDEKNNPSNKISLGTAKKSGK